MTFREFVEGNKFISNITVIYMKGKKKYLSDTYKIDRILTSVDEDILAQFGDFIVETIEEKHTRIGDNEYTERINLVIMEEA